MAGDAYSFGKITGYINLLVYDSAILWHVVAILFQLGGINYSSIRSL